MRGIIVDKIERAGAFVFYIFQHSGGSKPSLDALTISLRVCMIGIVEN